MFSKFFQKFTEQDILKIQNTDEILTMHPRRFEWFCKYLLPHFGYQGSFVTHKHGTYESDGGVDIQAWMNGEKVLIQCKRLTKGRNGYVPIEVIRALRGCMNDEIKHGVVIATLPFGNAAHREAEKYHIKLIGMDEIISVLKHINPRFNATDNE